MAEFDRPALPPALASDPRFSALCELLWEAHASLPLDKLLLYLIDVTPEAALLPLAEQFHVMGIEGWAFAQTDTQRRTLIKRSIELHRSKGTKWAIKQILVTLGMTGVVSEWFEYGGQPYHFRIDIDLSGRGMQPDDVARLVELIAQYKNVRSHLDGLHLSLTVASDVPRIACAMFTGQVTTLYPWTPAPLAQSATPHLAVGCCAIACVTLFPQEA